MSPNVSSQFGTSNNWVVKAGAGVVFSLTCTNTNTGTQYIQLHNTSGPIGNGAVPLLSFLVPTGTQIGIGTDIFTNDGLKFSTGIAVGFSSTRDSFTAGVAAENATTVVWA